MPQDIAIADQIYSICERPRQAASICSTPYIHQLNAMPTSTNKNWLPVVIIAGALLGWMGILAAGAYWAPVGEGEGGDHRKLWVVAATTGGFLLLWGGVLLRFSSKRRRNAQSKAKPAENAENSDSS